MIHAFSTLARAILRFLLLWAVDGLSLLITAAILPGFALDATAGQPRLVVAFSAAFLLGIVNLLIRPIILLLAKPLGFIGEFVLGFFVNAIALGITAWLLPGFELAGVGAAIGGGLIFSAINILLTGILDVGEEGSYYQNRIERLAKKEPFKGAAEPGRGLVMMEIDGLSFHHLLKVLADGRMPTLQRLIAEEGYIVSKVDCGIPSQTSACQAGIMFGDNDDIPAFRWYDKDKQKLYVSGSDAGEINARYARGNGLMRGGSSIDNMMNGDAEKSLLTLADLREADHEQKRRRAQDIYLLMLHPYFFMHAIVLFLGAVVRELWQGWQQKRKGVYPRLNRLHGGYPFIRAATTVFVRDIAASLTVLDIVRGAPAIYVTWPGYDEVAHHSGPWTDDALDELVRYDSAIARVLRAIREKAPRPYDLILLSDHGQSFGATFKQRYGVSLKEFIEQQLPKGTSVAQSIGGDTGIGSLTAVSAELGNIDEAGVGNRAGRAVARQGRKLLDKGPQAREQEDATTITPAQVTAYGSGNLAQVYFDLYPRRIKLSELDAAYPGMVDALVQHEGIGFVCGYQDDGVPVVLGKTGRRNLHTDEVIGQDPLLPYARAEGVGAASIETRVWQVRRVMDFAHAGDLMVVSSIYPDGTVAALEELIGSHGGVGGEQTDAFLLHPADMVVPPTRNSTDVFHILNARRGQPVSAAPQVKPRVQRAEVNQWTLANLWGGIKHVRLWLGRVARAVVLDRSAYQEVVLDSRMTGPALLIGLAMATLAAFLGGSGSPVVRLAIRWAAWLLVVLAVFAAGRLLTRRGTYTRTMRALGFSYAATIFTLLTLIPALAPLANLIAFLVTFLAAWMGASEAHEARGWRSILLPVVAVAVVVVAPAVTLALLSGAAFTIQSLFGAGQ